MKKYRPLFLTGTARGGTNLVKWILECNEDIVLESEPYLPLYTSLRNKIIQKHNYSGSVFQFKPNSPLDEYYFINEKINVMKAIQDSSLKVNFDKDELADLLKKVSTRMDDYVPHLKKYLHMFNGNDYASLF